MKEGKKEVNDFLDKWNQQHPYDRWHFRGFIVGYILAEVLMMIFSAGIATAVKWVGKLGRLAEK